MKYILRPALDVIVKNDITKKKKKNPNVDFGLVKKNWLNRKTKKCVCCSLISCVLESKSFVGIFGYARTKDIPTKRINMD